SLDILVVVTLTSWLRRAMSNSLWQWIHRTSYVAFVALFLHAATSGTDFDAPIVSAIAWSSAAALAVVGVSRIVWGRLPAWRPAEGPPQRVGEALCPRRLVVRSAGRDAQSHRRSIAERASEAAVQAHQLRRLCRRCALARSHADPGTRAQARRGGLGQH